MCNNLITSLSLGKNVHFPILISLYAAERREISPRSTFVRKSFIVANLMFNHSKCLNIDSSSTIAFESKLVLIVAISFINNDFINQFATYTKCVTLFPFL